MGCLNSKRADRSPAPSPRPVRTVSSVDQWSGFNSRLPGISGAVPTATVHPVLPEFPTTWINTSSPVSQRPQEPPTPAVSPTTTPASSHPHKPAAPAVTRDQDSKDRLSSSPLAPVVFKFGRASSWESDPLPDGESFRLVQLFPGDRDFQRVGRDFQNTSKNKKFEVVKIERVENPFLLGRYLLKKEEMQRRYGVVRETVNYHGTGQSKVRSICENNFDWKMHGKHKGNKFGRGVSFSPISFYASHYSDRDSRVKVMFYVKVLVSHSTVGDRNMTLPPEMEEGKRYDTTTKEDQHVVVKFSHDEYYPEFIIHYTKPPHPTYPKPHKQNRRQAYDDPWAM